MKKLFNITIRIIIYCYAIFLIGVVPYFFMNFSGKKIDKIAQSSTLKLYNETKNKEKKNEETKCRNCPHARKCANSSESADSTNGTPTETKSK